MVSLVQSFFLYGFMPKSINTSLLTLVPQTTDASRMSEYRPVACCNLFYKVISKIVANMMKKTLLRAIDTNHCVFVKRRLLLENFLLATERVKNYHMFNSSSRCAIKLDISKDFDMFPWPFIVATLRAMGYPKLLIKWVYMCMSTIFFYVSINGELEEFFTSARGIWQGCSLSLYLYVIVNNVMSKLLNNAALEGQIGYHPNFQDINLTHLSFVDDIMVFTDGSPSHYEAFWQFKTVLRKC